MTLPLSEVSSDAKASNLKVLVKSLEAWGLATLKDFEEEINVSWGLPIAIPVGGLGRLNGPRGVRARDSSEKRCKPPSL